jgi:hypothetical protein
MILIKMICLLFREATAKQHKSERRKQETENTRFLTRQREFKLEKNNVPFLDYASGTTCLVQSG